MKWKIENGENHFYGIFFLPGLSRNWLGLKQSIGSSTLGQFYPKVEIVAHLNLEANCLRWSEYLYLAIPQKYAKELSLLEISGKTKHILPKSPIHDQ